MFAASAARRASFALTTLSLFGLLLMLAPRARAIEAFDGRIQLHGFGEVQMRALSQNMSKEVDLAQWYNVLNLELEVDVAPDGFGPTDLVEAYVRVEARYDCVWTRGCGTMRSATTYGDRAAKVPPRLRDAKEANYTGVIPPTYPGTFDYRLNAQSTSPAKRIGDRKTANLQPTYVGKYNIENGMPVNAFPMAFVELRELLGEDFYIHEPIPDEGFPGFDTLWGLRGADNIVGTADDPAIYTFDALLTSGNPYSWALAKFKGPPGGANTQLIGPWRPKNFIKANALMLDRANPFRGGYTGTTNAYRGDDPLDPRLEVVKEAIELLGAPGLIPSLTVPKPGDVTGDSFAGDWSGIIPCKDPTSAQAEAQRRGTELTRECIPNFVALDTGNPSIATRDQEGANIRVSFDQASGRQQIRPGGAGELPMRPAPDLSNLLPKSANPKLLMAQGLYYPSTGLRNELSSGRLDGLGFNYTQAERAWNRGQSQQQTKELKEAYLDIEWLDSRLWTRIGKQNIVWGKTELFRTTDQFNPQDLALASLPSLEESRIGLWAFRAVYSLYDVGPLEDVRLEVAANFDEFQPADLGAAGEPFTPDVVGGLTTGILFHSITGVGVAGIDRPENPWDNINGLEIGGRIEWRWDRFSFALTDFYGYNDFPFIDRIWTYTRSNDYMTGRPLVGEYGQVIPKVKKGVLDPALTGVCDAPVLDQNTVDGMIDTYPVPSATGASLDDVSIIDSKSPQSYSILGIGAQPGCLKGGGAAGFVNADPTFQGAQNALEFHHANLQIFTWICNTTVGIGATLDAGSCAWNIFGTPVKLADVGGLELAPLGEVISAMTSGDPDTRNAAFWRAVSGNLKPGFNPLFNVPLVGMNRDPGPDDPTCPELVADFDLEGGAYAECSRWDGIITATNNQINRVNPNFPVQTIFTPDGPGGSLIPIPTNCSGTAQNPVNANLGPQFVTLIKAIVGNAYSKPTLGGICGQFLFFHNADDLLTLDSTLTNFQKALIGCGAFYGTRCDSSVLMEVLPEGLTLSNSALTQAGIDELEDSIKLLFPEGGGIDFVNTEASLLEQSWPGTEGTAPLGAEADQLIYWTTLGQKRQPGTALVDDPAGFYEKREFGPKCTRPDGNGGLIILPGCRGIETIRITRDPNTNIVDSIQIAFQQDYRPSIDGCLVGGNGGAPGDNVIGSIGGVPVTVVAGEGGYTPPIDEIDQCHTDSTHKVGDFTGFSTEVAGSGWIWHPYAGCLSEERSREVVSYGNNVDAEGNPYGACGEMLNAANNVVLRTTLDRFRDIDGDGIVDIEEEFLGSLPRVDGVFPTAQLFQNEMAAFSWNFLMFLVLSSCSVANEGSGNVKAKQECFDPEQSLRADKCSFNAPHLCANARGFLSVAGVTRNDVRAGGSDLYGRRTFIWHSGGEIALRYEKRNVLGFSTDFAEDMTKSNWGVEFTWIEGLPFTDNNKYGNTTKSDVLNLTVSVDRPTFVNFLNANRTFFFNSQWFFQYVTDYKGSFPTNGPWNVLFTFAAFTGYFQDRLLPTFVSVFDVQSQSGGFLPNVVYRFTESFSATIGVNMFFGGTQRTKMPLNEIAPVSNRAPAANNPGLAYKDGVDNLLSLVRKRDEFYLRLRWTF